MNEPIFRIFVSSTYKDLIPYRKAAEQAINDLGQKYDGMNYMGALDKEPIEASLEMVEQCDLFVGIYAWRYGFIPDESDISITEEEYRYAVKLNRPRLCYLIDKKYPWNPELIEMDQIEKLNCLKGDIEKERVCEYFRDPQDCKAKMISGISKWLLENKPKLTQGTPESDDKDPEKMYRKAISDKYATIAMLGFKRSFDMDGIYIPLTVHLDPECGFSRLPEKTDDKLFAHSLKAEDLLTIPDKVSVVLGEPGMGKTTMLYYLARRESKNPTGVLPIFVKLAEFCKTNESLESFLLAVISNHISGLGMQNLATAAMQQGTVLVLLDGLDEVNREQYISVTERIRAFISSHCFCRVIITSRKAGFQSHEVPYRIFEIDRLPFAEIETFVNKWFAKKNDLPSRIENNNRIYELAQNPFLLSIICLIFEKDHTLPERRVELYEKSAVTLLTLFEEIKKVPKVDLFTRQLKERVLEDVAYHFFCDGKNEFPYSPLMDRVSQTLTEMDRSENEENILREIRENSGLLQQSDDNHLFVHRTFYEYYVSRKMRADTQQTVLTRASEPRWEEPIRLYAAQIEPTTTGKKEGTQFLSQLWQKDRALALRCYPDMAQVVQPELIKDLLHKAKVDERVKLVKGLPEKIADADKVVETLRELFRWETNGEVLYWGVQILEEKGTPEALQIVRQRLDDGAEERYQKYLKMDMVQIPSGSFDMGSNDYDDEKPIHKVYLDGFLLSRYPVTNRLYELFDPEHKKQRDSYSDKDIQPVVYDNWYEAVIFCRWLGCRLPTEAEWEKAARGGKGLKYATKDGTISHKLANYHRKIDKTTAEGKYPANPYGLYDMSGNVWEWCQDWYDRDYYKQSPNKNSTGPTSGSRRVLRGGSWDTIQGNVLASSRFGNGPGNSRYIVGFRLVR